MGKSKSNRKIRIALARTFGEECMFKRSHAEQYVEKLGTIKTYKRYKVEKRYTAKQVKQLEAWLTLHHLKHRSEGGATSEENGAIINELAHRYMHSLPRSQEEIINDYIREWKRRYYEKCEVELVDDLEEDFEIDMSDLEISPIGTVRTRKYDRRQAKRETRELIDEYYEREN